MKIAVASGKGGTGKTTTAVALALTKVSEWTGKVTFADCDVEAPNAAIFLHPQISSNKEAGIQLPVVDQQKCTLCGTCAEICRYNAIAISGKKVVIFPEMCHGCGNCSLNCPENAIDEKFSRIGEIMSGETENMYFTHGLLDVGQMMATPVIKQLKDQIAEKETANDLLILDCPPGASCPMMETIEGADFLLLVTEPTPFGLHDLDKAVNIGRKVYQLPVGVVINRDGIGDEAVDQYCQNEDIPVLLRIPYDKEIALAYSNGLSILEAADGSYRQLFQELFLKIEKIVKEQP